MTELAWDSYRCQCGGEAVMGIMSLVAHCDKCPRVYVSSFSGNRWYSNIAEANDVENDYWSRKAASRIQRDPVEQGMKGAPHE